MIGSYFGCLGFDTMEIPRPRLKGLQEIDLEEKVAEKAVLAIRRKTLQVDTDIERIREEVEGELDRLDTQRSSLEQGMQTLMEEQALILSALSELEDRQTRHKQNLSMLKDEEIEIESERKGLNSALKQLRSRQKSIKDMVSKKFSPFESMKMKGRLSEHGDFSSGRDMWAYSGSDQGKPRWGANSQNEQAEPNVKIISQSSQYAMSARPNLDLPPSEGDARINSASADFQIAPQASSPYGNPASSKKPSILGRIRSATDRYLPEPFRKNKPSIAILEERAENADSAQVIESYSSKNDLESSPDLPYEEVAQKNPFPKTAAGNSPSQNQKKSAGQTIPKSQPGPQGASLENEISQFEEKLTLMDDGPEESNSEQGGSMDLKSKISSIVRMNKNAPARAQMTGNAPSGASKQNFTSSSQLPRFGVYDYNQASPGANPSPLPQMAASPRYSHHQSVGTLNSASQLYTPGNDRLAKTKSEIVRKLTTEAKLARLHSKLSEMKSALKSLSKAEDSKAKSLENGARHAKSRMEMPISPLARINPAAHQKSKVPKSNSAKHVGAAKQNAKKKKR